MWSDYSDIHKRQPADSDQKMRLCICTVDSLNNLTNVQHQTRSINLFIGPGSTSTLFIEKLYELIGFQSGHSVKIVSNNLHLLITLDRLRVNNSLIPPVFKICGGESIDFYNLSLFSASSEIELLLDPEIKESFAIISCSDVFKVDDRFIIVSHTSEHAKLLSSIVKAPFKRIYVIIDDSKKAHDIETVHNEYLEIGREFVSKNIAFVVEVSGRPKCYSGNEVYLGLSEWWVKPRPSCFISYQQNQGSIVERLYNELNQSGMDAWRWNNIRTSERILPEIKANILSREYFIIILEKGAIASEYVRYEAQFAIDHGKKIIGINVDDSAIKWSEKSSIPGRETPQDLLQQIFLIPANGWETDELKYKSVFSMIKRKLIS